MIIKSDGTNMGYCGANGFFGNIYEWEFNPKTLSILKRQKQQQLYRDGSVYEAIEWVQSILEIRHNQGLQPTIMKLCESFLAVYEIEGKPGYKKEQLAANIYQRLRKTLPQKVGRRVTRHKRII